MGEQLPQLAPGHMLKETWRVVKKLGEGGFGAVYKMEHARTGEQYAMKVEGVREQIQVLKMEVLVLQSLKERGSRHGCAILDRGRNDQFNYVIMTLVGKSLQDLRKEGQGGHLSLSSALRAGRQCLEATADLHNIGYLHRDIKPGNFAVGRAEVAQQRTVFILDFGLARKFVKDTGEIRTPRAAAGFRGTVRYAPINCHRSKELGRKDDLETWFYMQVELTLGRLPWSAVQDMHEVGRLKEANRHDGSLFAGCPPQYPPILQYIDGLQYWDQPDYELIYRHINTAVTANNFREEDPYDWERPAW
jgi:tau tubulin kinase